MQNKKELIQALKFLGFSVSAGVIQVLSFTLLNEILLVDYWVSYLTALILSVLWNFTLNRKFTFKSASNVPIAMLKVALFYAVFTPLSTLGGDYLESIGWNEYLVLAISMALNFVLEYVYQKFFVFTDVLNKKEDVKEEPKEEK
ncbi:MAG: GtrA family protein [Clostridia bacterium]|nr:GtrA family protein [Clostridia bacterium]